MPVKIKIFAVAMAVMCLMSCMCMTAFADESAPTFTNFIQNGTPVTIPANANDKDTLPVLKLTEGVTYTIESDDKLRVLGWSGTSWVTISDSIAVPYEYTADGTYTHLGFATHAYSNDPGTLTATWTIVSPVTKFLSQVGSVLTGFTTNIGGPILEFVVSHPLTIVPALAGLCVIGLYIIRKFVYGA